MDMEKIKGIILIVMGAFDLWPAMAIVSNNNFWKTIGKAFGKGVNITNAIPVLGLAMFIMGIGVIVLGVLKLLDK